MTHNYFDLQVNGYLKIEFSSADETTDNIRLAFNSYLEKGAGAFLPTVITSARGNYKKNLPRLAALINEPYFKNKIPGIHLEGPFISPSAGAVGAHNPEWVSTPDTDYLKELNDLAEGKIILLTIAAELHGAEAFCREAVKMGIIVSLGHQLAGYSDLERLYQAGAKTLTHLGNGMPNEVHRHYNPLINGLLHPGLIPMLIADGHHLPPYLIKGIINLKGIENVIIVSDASPIAGMPPGQYNSLGNDIILEENGYLHNPSKKCLVGSSFTLADCAHFLKNTLKFSPQQIDTLCRINAERVVMSTGHPKP
ncbi:MAG: hypothetical protein A2096_07555 [Spirochaetes bacterium GWF1_41_5]|nr:MAG: hypothetical protein A2096_07555 [Spirochaetes bacterium GWF1_41_5]HBE02549.1 hypothetical protein [Spirochaetia bacterium]